jgi:hypothetical protein
MQHLLTVSNLLHILHIWLLSFEHAVLHYLPVPLLYLLRFCHKLYIVR